MNAHPLDDRITCRYCRGERPTDGRRCLGCGAPVANARVNSRTRKVTPRKCPRCRSGSYSTLEEGRFECRSCRTVYEDDDVGYLDTRPIENAIKREGRRA